MADKPNWLVNIEERKLKNAPGRPKEERTKITIPYNFELREYQKPFWRAIQDDPVKRAIVVWHRRAGKDKTFYNALVLQAIRRVAIYYYVFPEFNQGRKALWDNIDKSGFRTIDHCPPELRKRIDNQQMKIELKNGSIIQIIGASDIDRIVGTNPAGIVFSEYSLISPQVYGYLLPIVSENDGFMWFNLTPRGNNHAKILWDQACNDEDWFSQLVTAEQSKTYTPEQLEKVKQEYFKQYKDYTLFNQEMLCSFDEAVEGSYYGKHIADLEEHGHMGAFPYNPSEPVHTYWDIGIGDATAIWFAQFIKDKIYLIDYVEKTNVGMDWYIKHLQNKPYIYGEHYGPHDIKQREFGTGLSRVEVAKKLGFNIRISNKLNVTDGINAVRMTLPKCFFNTDNEAVLESVANLRNYHKEFNPKTQTFKDTPYHDWSSHTADAFRYLCVNYNRQNNISNSVEHLSSDIPEYARADISSQPRTPRRGNPFGYPEPDEAYDLTTDAFNKDGWVR